MKACPECDAMLNFSGECGACGWAPRAKKTSGPQLDKPCADCAERFLLWTSLTEGTDGKRRCATCHIAYLKASQDHAERCECGKLVKDHIAEFKRAGALMSERVVKL